MALAKYLNFVNFHVPGYTSFQPFHVAWICPCMFFTSCNKTRFYRSEKFEHWISFPPKTAQLKQARTEHAFLLLIACMHATYIDLNHGDYSMQLMSVWYCRLVKWLLLEWRTDLHGHAHSFLSTTSFNWRHEYLLYIIYTCMHAPGGNNLCIKARRIL